MFRKSKLSVAVLAAAGTLSAGQVIAQEGMIVRVTEIDPICAMQACMDGYEVVSPYINGINTGKKEDIDLRLMQGTDMIVTCTGNVNVCDENLLATVASNAVVCNIGHFDTEIDTQFMRDNWLSNRVFKSYDDIVALCCEAWNNLIDRPWKIMSIGCRQWAHGF